MSRLLTKVTALATLALGLLNTIDAIGSANTFDVRFACKSTCLADVAQCGALLTSVGKGGLVPDCDSYIPGTPKTVPPGVLFQPDKTCNVVTSKSGAGAGAGTGAGNATAGAATCVPPFIKDTMQGPGGTSTNTNYCNMGCCLPCPAQYSLYRTNALETGFMITNTMRAISMVFSFVLMVSYIFLPDKRSHPSALILYFSICVFLFSVVVIFPLINTRGMQCFDAINPSTQQNNIKCAIQGGILIFASVSTCAWCSALIVNLHLHTVWNSAWFAKKYWLLHIICWGLAASITGAALGMGEVKWEYATLCLISQEKSSEIFFYPMAAMIFPAFLIHIATFIHIARISAQAGIDSETMSRSTLSAGAAAKIKPETLMPWVTKFAVCIMTPGSTHDSCADELAPHLPPYALMIAAEFLVSMIGTIIFVVFFKIALIREWSDWFGSVGYLLSGKRRQKKEQDQFFVI
ncbi:hypothetical protein BGX26_010804 [Mortierella sp. AD094]|nr:hypothetical protein BGX26_010804 [Mortierella sp. AD094]